jgi:DNA-directed RNA polymerase subunit RPC12/RpoP
MNVTAVCASCGRKYAVDERFAARAASCKHCGAALKFSARNSPAQAASMLRAKCPDCGKSYSISSELAGKKIVCSNCKAKFRIADPGSSAPMSKSAERSSKPSAAVEAAPPPPADLDVYGLDESPVAPTVPGSGVAQPEAPLKTGPVRAGSDSEPGLPRREGYKPLSDKKKKQIRKRADKLDRLKPSTAGVGISFGAVLAFALIGWRVYRVVHRFERAAARANAAQSAPEDVDVDFDPAKILAEMDKEAERMIADKGTAEARDWLDAAKYPNHSVMEMSAEDARAMVAGFYERGAEKVYVLDPVALGNNLVTAQFAVKLPQDAAARQKCLEWEAKCQEQDGPSPDRGQKYLLISTD